ncbi:protein-disulfide reductase DsbD family protein [Ascidiimonas sp. W6]|uniref:protein-disulfide reductase DsbD family protein n=1 Tax=Ascidiimonas meishanensis TaxID=3128903 RepID=UPI0030EB81B6
MKRFIFLISVICTFFGYAQDPINWTSSVEKISDTEFILVFQAEIENGWHLYSIKEPKDLGPIPTSINFENKNNDFEVLGGPTESETITEFDKVFETELSFFDKKAIFKQRIQILNKATNQIKAWVEYQACDDEVCIFRDEEFLFSLDGSAVKQEAVTLDAKSIALSNQLKLPLENKGVLSKDQKEITNGENYWGIFALGFLGGLLALLTPCVFPMIPLTVSFFTKSATTNKKGITNAILYGFFIVLIYFLLSLPFHFLDSIQPELLNTISTNIWLNLFFFVIFIFFAFSFFGYYELTLPASWSNKMDNASGVGGVIGIFFMAVTLAIVSFSCTGPILGGLLGSTTLSEGNVAFNLSLGMTGFGLALALPFALFALFPGWLNSLPKSGGWLNTVKVVLGFLELALAFKFLSNADLVSHWGILKYEIFIGIWIVVFLLMALYLFGKLRFNHDAPLKKLSKIRLSLGIITVLFVLYLAAGLGKMIPLKLISGFPPPQFYSVFETKNDCPLGLNCFKDFDEGLQYAQKSNKPILLDFTGWACVNCRKMEETVWSDPEVFNLINEKYVLISLYVDDRKALPEEEQFGYQLKSNRIKQIQTIGDKWATFQALNFQTASQPYYILMSPNFEILNEAQQYSGTETYYNWLQGGLKNFKP